MKEGFESSLENLDRMQVRLHSRKDRKMAIIQLLGQSKGLCRQLLVMYE